MSDNINIYDKDRLTKVLRATDYAGAVIPHHIIEPNGNAFCSFGRLRVAAPSYRFDSQLTYRVDTDLWDTATSGGSVTHSATERWAAMQANASGSNSAVIQSHYAAPYTPGRGQLAFITGKIGAAPATGGIKRMGLYDGTNGFYLERTDSAVNLVLLSSTTNGTETVPQASWNIDPMDGTGPSGITLDLTKVQILVVEFQALYVGRVVIGFDIAGILVPVHQFNCANVDAYPYIAQANLPVRYEVTATADTGNAVTMHAVCSSVISEGGEDLQDIPGRQFAAYGSLSGAASGALIALRCKAQLNSINSNVLAIPTELDVSVADAGAWVIVKRNATVSAGTFEDVDAASSVEMSWAGNSGTDPTITGGTGTVIDRFYVPASASVRSSKVQGLSGKVLLAYSHLLSAGDVLTVEYEGGGATTDVFASVKWKEIR